MSGAASPGVRGAAGAGAGPTKKLINSPETCVDENLRGLVAVYPQLRLHPSKRLVTSKQGGISSAVAVISGGGSGHEPFAAGYVGRGMLSGAVSGGIFTSPPPSHVLYGITYLHRYNQGGVLVVIPNYTGDRLNFGMAIEKARNAGLRVESIIVDEDLASGQNSSTGARGMCGLTVIYKVCGALAAEGADLSTVQETGAEILKNMATFGVSLRACSIPGQAPLFEVAADEMELGTGVHGEAGVTRAPLGSAREVTALVLVRLVDNLALRAGSRVAAVVNNMGGTTALEMNIVCAEIAAYLKNQGIILERMFSGHVMTCLDMHGFQINVIRLQEPHSATWLRLLDAATDAPGWPGGRMSLPSLEDSILPDVDITGATVQSGWKQGPELDTSLRGKFRVCLVTAAHALISYEDKLNRLDAGCGDGDCGSTLRNLAEAKQYEAEYVMIGTMQEMLNNETYDPKTTNILAFLRYVKTTSLDHPAETFAKLSEIAENDMGGTSGGIYSLGFAAASRIIAEEQVVTPATWLRAWNGANKAIMKYGRANLGDRTMVDTLVPAAAAFENELSKGQLTAALLATLTAADEGAKSTAAMKARAGRASYVGEAYLGGEDAGARGAAVWLHAILSTLTAHSVELCADETVMSSF